MRYHGRMPSNFDTDAEDAKLAGIRAKEAEDLTRVLAEKHDLPYMDLALMPINMDALRVVPQKDAEEAEAIAFEKIGQQLRIAVRNPDSDVLKRSLHELEVHGYQIELYLCSAESIRRGLERYKDLSLASESKNGVFDVSPEELAALSAQLTDMPALRAFLSDSTESGNHTQTSKLLEGIMAAAVSMGASDVHLEPEETQIRMRFRLDGLLTDVFEFNEHSYKLLNSRIKLLSGLKLNITDRAQDGRFTLALSDKEIEIRTSVIPGNYGESIVMRVLDPSSIRHTLDSMGIHPKLLARLREEIKHPNGMLLNTGPTGSGKTTTLYAFLQEIYTTDLKIITIEDPVEYHLNGIVQTQVNGEDYSFSSGLRSVLRQDPDIIMVGEVRDEDVLKTAMQFALTGHFVFTTLHTNDAAGTFPRLVDLGADPKEFSSAIRVSMAQRLVRTLDPETRTMRPTTEDEKEKIRKIFADLADPSLMPTSIDQVGAPAPKDSNDSGYKGRTGLYEAIFMDEALGHLLRDNPSSGDIAKEAAKQGYLTMAQDGVLKALTGVTSLEEVFSVVDVPH